MRKLSKGIFNNPLQLFLFLSITASFLIYSCKKSEVLPEAAEENLQKPVRADPSNDKFFELSANVSPQVKIIAGNIKKHDAKNHS